MVRGDDSAFSEGRGCYTSVRIEDGRPWFPARHVRRLQRGAKGLGLGEVDADEVLRALSELAAKAFPDGDGIVRLQVSRDGTGRTHLTGVPRATGEEPAAWSAITAPFPHPGPVLAGGHKLSNRLAMALAMDAFREAGADEALLLDASGHLVEGSRTNVFVATRAGELVTPPDGCGLVSGIARDVVLERVPGAVHREIPREALRTCAELVSVNSVRGASPIVRLDGEPVGDGAPGPWAARLEEALRRGRLES